MWSMRIIRGVERAGNHRLGQTDFHTKTHSNRAAVRLHDYQSSYQVLRLIIIVIRGAIHEVSGISSDAWKSMQQSKQHLAQDALVWTMSVTVRTKVTLLLLYKSSLSTLSNKSSLSTFIK